MKNFKIFFGSLAFVLAIGAAFSAQSSSKLLVSGFKQITGDCVASDDCSNTGSVNCTTSLGEQIYRTDNGTTCANAMVREQ